MLISPIAYDNNVYIIFDYVRSYSCGFNLSYICVNSTTLFWFLEIFIPLSVVWEMILVNWGLIFDRFTPLTSIRRCEPKTEKLRTAWYHPNAETGMANASRWKASSPQRATLLFLWWTQTTMKNSTVDVCCRTRISGHFVFKESFKI